MMHLQEELTSDSGIQQPIPMCSRQASDRTGFPVAHKMMIDRSYIPVKTMR